MKKLLIILLLILPNLAFAQNAARNPCYGTNGLNCVPVTIANPLPVTDAGYASGVTASSGSNTGSTGAVTAALAAVLGKTQYLCSIQVGESGTGSASAQALNLINNLNYIITAPANFTITYNPCLPASAISTPISLTVGANASATTVTVNVTGYSK